MKGAFELALKNVARFGDTDVLPYPIENHIFFDKPDEAAGLLEAIDREFKGQLSRHPPFHEGSVTAAGFFGFRWATQIDPIWNAYFLALVVTLGEAIERARLPVEDGIVFSYRFKPNLEDGSLFDRAFGWEEYQRASLELAGRYDHVLACDISDFYPRVYHHRLENELERAAPREKTIRTRIKTLLERLSRNASYGLPVGGPGSRLLSELLLNAVDRLLVTADVPFCRFADDYHLFAATPEQAYRHLIYLTEKLYDNQGLNLQKAKTRLMSAAEFRATSPFARDREPVSEEEASEWSFLNLKVRYDPYSQTAAEEYETLKAELAKYDVLGMLVREVEKSRPHPHLTRRLLAAVEHLEPAHRDQAAETLLDNLTVLYPVLSHVLILLKTIVSGLGPEIRGMVFEALRRLITEDSHLVSVPAHLSYTIRVLACDRADATAAATDKALVKAFKSPSSLVRRDVILAMARRERRHWLEDLLRSRYLALGAWERRALLIASYILGDAGRHWRRKIQDELSPLDHLAEQWAGSKKATGNWEIPL